MKDPLPRNTILRRAFWADGENFYFRMADGSLIKPETAIKRGLIDRAVYEQALREEKEMKKCLSQQKIN